MPLTDASVINVYNGNGIATSFAYTATIFDATQLIVEVDDVEQVYLTDYTLSAIGAGGNVLFTTAPASGTKNVVIRRYLPLSRSQDYPDSGALRDDTLDRDFDERMAQIQQVAADVELSLKLPVSESGSTFNTTFPAPDPGKYVRCKSDGTGFEYVNITVDSGTLITTTWSENWLQLSSSASALTELGIDSPSTTVAGIWEAATDAEAIAGTATNRTVTPSNLFAYAKAVATTAGTEPAYTATHTHAKIDAVTTAGTAVTINGIALKFVTGEVVRDFHLAVNDIVHFVIDGANAYWLNPPNRPIDLSSYSGADYALRVGESAKYSISGVASKALRLDFDELQKYKIEISSAWGAADKYLALSQNGSFSAGGYNVAYNGGTGSNCSVICVTGLGRNQKLDVVLFTGSSANLPASKGNYACNDATNVYGGSLGVLPVGAYAAISTLTVGVMDSINATSFSATTFTACELTITRIS